MPDPEVVRLLQRDQVEALKARRVLSSALRKTPASPKEAQIAFLKSLVENPQEAKQFQKDPKTYAVNHGILLDPKLVQAITNSAVFQTPIARSLIPKLGEQSVKDLIELRACVKGPSTANAAAVAAGAAVVMAAVMVVTMVVTLVRTKRPADLVALRGLGPQGIRLAGGTRFGGIR